MLVWKVADVEAKNLRSALIEPCHFFLALCKVVDLDIDGMSSENARAGSGVLEEVAREVRRIRRVFEASEVDPKVLRRRLRRAYGRDSLDICQEGPLRRSESAKRVFSAAEHSSNLSDLGVCPIHLLSAILSVEDFKRDSTIAKLGFYKDALVKMSNEEILRLEDGGAGVTLPA